MVEDLDMNEVIAHIYTFVGILSYRSLRMVQVYWQCTVIVTAAVML